MKQRKNNNSLKASTYGDNSRNKHIRFSDDNIRRKCKVLVLSYVKDFINEKLASIYRFNQNKEIKKPKLLVLNKNQVANSKIKENIFWFYKY